MKIRINRFGLVDTILLLQILVQFMMIFAGTFATYDSLNLAIFYNNYAIIALIVISLIRKGGANHFLALMFFICFFIFLMGQKIFKEEKNVFLTFARTTLDTQQFFTFTVIMALGIIVTYYSYILFFYNNKDTNSNVQVKVRNPRPILPLIRLVYFITLPAAIYMQMKIVLVRSAISYTSGYLMNVNVPTIIKVGYYIFASFTLIYLATRPSKKEVYFIISVFLIIEGGVQLVQGRRALFATTLFFVIWYLIKFYGIKKVNMKYFLYFTLGGIALVVLFFYVEMQRSGINIGKVNLLYIVERFMSSTGGSDSVIANTIDKANLFPKSGIVYLIDPIINNPIAVILTGKGGINQGIDHLNSFNSFSNWISYLTQSSLYMSGHGMGSCYLAELYLAFGCMGVFVGSIVVGFFLNYMTQINLNGSIFKTSIVFLLVKSLFTLPRSGFFSWFGDFTYLFVAFCIIYPFYNIYCKNWELLGENNEPQVSNFD